MTGSFAFLWKLISNLLYYRTKRVSKLNGFIAGSIASLSFLFESRENRVLYNQQLFMRAMQAGKNALKYRDIPTIPHGDAIIFAFSCASILYAYAFRPDTLPREYYSWMVKKAMVPKKCLEFHAEHCLNQAKLGDGYKVDMDKVDNLLKTVKATDFNTTLVKDYVNSANGSMLRVPCAVFHPNQNSCFKHNARLYFNTFTSMIPVYGALTGIPLIIFKTSHIIKNPGVYLRRLAKSVLQSCAFLGSYLTLFQSGMCVWSYFCPNTSTRKFIYINGFIAGIISIFVEQKPKRVELAMFSAPKAIQSLYIILIDNGYGYLDIKGIEIPFGMVSMGILMSLYQTESQHMSGMIFKFFKAVLGNY